MRCTPNFAYPTTLPTVKGGVKQQVLLVRVQGSEFRQKALDPKHYNRAPARDCS